MRLTKAQEKELARMADWLRAHGAREAERAEWIGTAADGVEVSFGATLGAYNYLMANPTPDKW